MRREGSPWTGLWAVFFKEMADHLTGLRMRILEVLILLSALGALYTGSQALRQTVGEDPFLYLKLLTTAQDPLPSFVGFLSFFIPLAAIALAFDAVNGEYARGTLSRVLSQPIYRDALLFGKFLAGLGTLALLLFALFLMVVGLGLLRLGVPPGSEEVGRAFFFLLARIAFKKFVNKNRLFSKELMRALQNEFRRKFKITKVPVRFVLRERKRSPAKKG